MGHRQWLFKPSIGTVGIGFYAGGGQYGSAQCTYVGGNGGGPNPTWFAFPPPGPSPISIFSWAWSFHPKSGVSGATVAVTRVSDGVSMAMKWAVSSFPVITTLVFRPDGWTPAVGERYQVEITGVTGGPYAYEVQPVSCN